MCIRKEASALLWTPYPGIGGGGYVSCPHFPLNILDFFECMYRVMSRIADFSKLQRLRCEHVG